MFKFLVEHKQGSWRSYFRDNINWRPSQWRNLMIFEYDNGKWKTVKEIKNNVR